MASTSAAEPSTAVKRLSRMVLRKYSTKSGLVSITIRLASPRIRSSTGRQNVPTPGPYSTNRSHSSHLTGASILVIVNRLDGMIDPTITGCLTKPLKNTPHGPIACSIRRLIRVASGAGAVWVVVMSGCEPFCLRSAARGKFAPALQAAAPRPNRLAMDMHRGGTPISGEDAAGIRLPRDRLTLLFLVMLVTAAGNTAMQSVMPSIGTRLQ